MQVACKRCSNSAALEKLFYGTKQNSCIFYEELAKNHSKTASHTPISVYTYKPEKNRIYRLPISFDDFCFFASMNANCYKVIFSKRLGTLVAVGEHTTSSGKAASGQAVRGVIQPMPCFEGVADGFVGVLRFSFTSIALACLSFGNTQAQSSLPTIATSALPQGASVNKGSASISTSGAQMAITQSSDKASINWQSFNVGTGASVNIAQAYGLRQTQSLVTSE